ncbi:MAG TPA: TOBE domain-containing protein, partial [Dongiaceae bacterium]
EIMQLHNALGSTMIYVTHDQVEAMTMADRIVVLNKGRIEQVGTPLELYNRPDTLFVAGFIGSPKMNILQGAPARAANAEMIGIRPEHLALSTTGGQWPGRVLIAEHLGSDTYLHIEGDGIGRVTARAPGEFPHGPGETVWMTPEANRLHRFDAQGKAVRA